MDSPLYKAVLIDRSAPRRRFAVTVPMNSSVRAAIAAIGEGLEPRYPQAVWDEQLDCWIDEVAETGPAFASKKGWR